MAVLNVSLTESIDELLTTTLKNYRRKLMDQVFRGLPLLFWLEKAGRKKLIDGGQQIVVPLMYGLNNTTQNYAGYDTINVTPQKGLTSAFFDWKNAAVSISISREEERKNSGAARLIPLLDTKVTQAEQSLRWYLADMLHGRHGSGRTTYCSSDSNTYDSVGGTLIDSGDGTSNMFCSLDHLIRMPWGMADQFGSGSGGTRAHTVGKVACSTTITASSVNSYSDFADTQTMAAEQNTWWHNYCTPGYQKSVRDTTNSTVKLGPQTTTTENTYAGYFGGGTGGVNGINAMRSMYNRLSDEGDTPDLILCNQSPYELYEQALQPLERFTDTRLGDAGFQNLKFKTCTMIMDNGIATSMPTVNPTAAAPATPMYFLNSKYLEWTVDSKTDFESTPFYRPPNQVARTAQILLMAQLVVTNRSKHGVIAVANASSNTYSA